MKKYILLLIVCLSVLTFSCKKKYSGCCQYEVIGTSPTSTNYNKAIQSYDFCETDIEEDHKQNIMDAYNNAISSAAASTNTTYSYKVVGEGCSFHKGKK